MRKIEFLGTSRRELQKFPVQARKDAGQSLLRVQQGLEPLDWKPFPSVGAGVQELRIWESSGTFRIIYYARLESAVYVLHAFEKKTQQTAQREVDLARRRFTELMRHRRNG